MKLIKIKNSNSNLEAIEKAAQVLTSGGVIVYPTDTAYGLGANALDERAVTKIYNLMARSSSKPTHVIVKDWDMIELIAKPNESAMKLYERFFPGPLTMVLPKKEDIVPDVLTGGLSTIGVRISDTPFTLALSNLVSFPYTTPSANRSGEETPYSIEDVKSVLDVKKVDLVLDGRRLKPTPPSTLIDVTQDQPKILREGPITLEQISETLNAR